MDPAAEGERWWGSSREVAGRIYVHCSSDDTLVLEYELSTCRRASEEFDSRSGPGHATPPLHSLDGRP